MIVRHVSPALLAAILAFGACRKPEIQSYRTPKESVAANPAMPNDHNHAGVTAGARPAAPAASREAMANTAVPTASGSGLTWKAPAHWKAKPGSAMRKGSFTVTADGAPGEGDLSITAFPGSVGGDLANVNRWREQVGLPPVSQADFASAVQVLERNGLKISVVDLSGTGEKPEGILAAMIPHGGSTWFVKLSGSAALLAKAKPAFMQFLDTIAPASAP